jgi:hypothetical protein
MLQRKGAIVGKLNRGQCMNTFYTFGRPCLVEWKDACTLEEGFGGFVAFLSVSD